MYLEKAIFINRAPFEHLELDFKANGINVLSAVNGKGKTTILSHIVDAFHEMTRDTFSGSYEGKETKYYRISSAIFSLNMSEPSLVYFRFRENNHTFDYIDIKGACTEHKYNDSIKIDNKIPYDSFQSNLSTYGDIKRCSSEFTKEAREQVFKENILTYFSAYRHEQPGYLTEPYKTELKFNLNWKFSNELPNPIETTSCIDRCANWLMDIVLDKQLYGTGDAQHGVLLSNANKIITASVTAKHQLVRVGIGPRTDGNMRLSLVAPDGTRLYPSIFTLSSGELSVICIFCELLRQADKIGKSLDASGIVLIDEIDKHLHIKLQKEILPQLLILFPNVQFIVSSHSPFLNMGLAEQLPERAQVIDLDNNGIACSPTNNTLYDEVYQMMIKENDQFARRYQALKAQVEASTKPLIITEGKTDIKHIQKAKAQLGITDIDFTYIDTQHQPDGYDGLDKLLQQLAKIQLPHKVIGIFDTDVDSICKTLKTDEQPFKNYGNGVYGFCISPPQQRVDKEQTKISIEYLYSDSEIKTTLSNGCRLFFGTEFTRNSNWHNSEEYSLDKPDGKAKDRIIENNGGQAVYNRSDNNILAKKKILQKQS